jgi:hypothetical protein
VETGAEKNIPRATVRMAASSISDGKAATKPRAGLGILKSKNPLLHLTTADNNAI